MHKILASNKLKWHGWKYILVFFSTDKGRIGVKLAYTFKDFQFFTEVEYCLFILYSCS